MKIPENVTRVWTRRRIVLKDAILFYLALGTLMFFFTLLDRPRLFLCHYCPFAGTADKLKSLLNPKRGVTVLLVLAATRTLLLQFIHSILTTHLYIPLLEHERRLLLSCAISRISIPIALFPPPPSLFPSTPLPNTAISALSTLYATSTRRNDKFQTSCLGFSRTATVADIYTLQIFVLPFFTFICTLPLTFSR